MKYLKYLNENRILVTSKPQREEKPKEGLETIFFNMIFDDLIGIYGCKIDDLTDDMNSQEGLDDWIYWIQKHTGDDTKKLLGGYFQKYYFYIKGVRDEKVSLKEYIQQELLKYLSDK